MCLIYSYVHTLCSIKSFHFSTNYSLQSRQEYKAAYLAHLSSPTSSATLSNFIDAHNAYVRQLHATNGMVEQYTKDTLPALLQVRFSCNNICCSVKIWLWTIGETGKMMRIGRGGIFGWEIKGDKRSTARIKEYDWVLTI